MNSDFDQILDECIDRINRGESIDSCLSRYPEHGVELKPLLQSMFEVQQDCSFTPSHDAKRAARQRFYTALDKQKKSSPLKRPLVWATVALVLVISFIGMRAWFPSIGPITPTTTPPVVITIPAANLDGNFAFLLSDEVNAIGDFTNLNVRITRVSLQTSGGQDVEFEPSLKEADLTRLQGDAYQEMWRGDIPSGDYSKVFIYIDNVRGILKATGKTVEIKLPSQKLQISHSFQISTDTITSFTYDLTVVVAGQKGKYILKPQIDQSGAQQRVKP
jgi:hypothetical protein